MTKFNNLNSDNQIIILALNKRGYIPDALDLVKMVLKLEDKLILTENNRDERRLKAKDVINENKNLKSNYKQALSDVVKLSKENKELKEEIGEWINAVRNR